MVQEPRFDGSWNVLKRQLFEVRELTSWAVLNICTSHVNAQQCKDCMINLMNCCKALGEYLIAFHLHIDSTSPLGMREYMIC